MDACEEPLFANTANLERSDQVPCACSVTPACGSGFSIFGDSISTLQGYIPKGWRVHYEGEVSVPGVVHVHETWWGRVVDHFQGHLVANASFSGSVVEGFGFPAATAMSVFVRSWAPQARFPKSAAILLRWACVRSPTWLSRRWRAVARATSRHR